MIESIADNLINGNLKDAKRQAKEVGLGELVAGLLDLGWSKTKSYTAAIYLNDPSNETFQAFCDADRKEAA